MSNLTTRQWEAHIWLSRMWNVGNKIESFKTRQADIISSLSGIGKYDSEHIPTQNGENSTESKNIEYSILSEQIEKLNNELSAENVKTMEILANIQDIIIYDMLYDRYVLRMSWSQIGSKYHYAQRQPYRYMHKCLDEIRQYIPEEEIKEVVYGESDREVG